ncbi:tryptophan synthase subunit alpha [Oceanobacillus saliphilus]|uniref:tryptophan synthase subunit alpha n=1 Tax=Oceanobacillus saliphilus TaxID=2925834 RepID=UPI00201DE29A|nr:tryptophan synthase subunit alpha [Oceanobacillus saliphilus]
MGKAKLEKALQAKINSKENIFVPYIMAGDGGLEILEEQIDFLQKSGASAIEIGIPFSDPVADGPIIQEAGIRALKNGTTLANVLEVLKDSNERRSIPIVVMTYLNPVFVYGIERFAKDCVEAGVDGVIIPDLPMEEESIIAPSLSNHEVAYIRLAAMTSPQERIRELAKRSEGFLYAVAVNGTTGERTAHDKKVTSYLENLKKQSNVPVLAGFGVSSTQQAKNLGAHCDGVIVGSKIVQLLHEDRLKEIRSLIEGSILSEITN